LFWPRERGQQSRARERWLISLCFGYVSWWGEKPLITGKSEWRVARGEGRVASGEWQWGETKEKGNKRKNEKKEVLNINFK